MVMLDFVVCPVLFCFILLDYPWIVLWFALIGYSFGVNLINLKQVLHKHCVLLLLYIIYIFS